MERRNFLRAMLGVAAATALPSEVWPFRKIFLPPIEPIQFLEPPIIDWARVDHINLTYWGLQRTDYPGRLGVEGRSLTACAMILREQNGKIAAREYDMKEAHGELLRKLFS